MISQFDEMLRALAYERAVALKVLITALTAQACTVGIADDTKAHPAWTNVIFADLPTGQVSWHIHRDDVHLFEGLPRYSGKWDGHTKEERNNRIDNWYKKEVNWRTTRNDKLPSTGD